MLQAMNTGHDGSMTTLHANSPRDAVHRLQLLAGFAGFAGDERTFLHQVGSAVDIIIHVARLSNGKRRLMSVERVGEVGADRLALDAEFVFERERDAHVRCARAA